MRTLRCQGTRPSSTVLRKVGKVRRYLGCSKSGPSVPVVSEAFLGQARDDAQLACIGRRRRYPSLLQQPSAPHWASAEHGPAIKVLLSQSLATIGPNWSHKFDSDRSRPFLGLFGWSLDSYEPRKNHRYLSVVVAALFLSSTLVFLCLWRWFAEVSVNTMICLNWAVCANKRVLPCKFSCYLKMPPPSQLLPFPLFS